MSVKERVIEFIKAQHLKVSEFEKRCGLSNGYVSSMRKGFGTEKLDNVLREFPTLNREWLLYGEGEMLKPNGEDRANAKMIGRVFTADQRDSDVVMIDFVPVSATASFIESLSDGATAMDKLPLIPFGNERDEVDSLAVFEVDGDSMFPTIPSGSLILAKKIPERSWHYAEGVVVAVFAEYVVVKRIGRNCLLTDNYIVLRSDNEGYGEMTVALADIRGLYKAKRIISSAIR